MEDLKEGDNFNNYVDFFAMLEKHGKSNSIQWVKADSKSVETANKALMGSAKPYDSKFAYRYVRFRCKHGGQGRKQGLGLRPNQRSFKSCCPAEVYVTAERDIGKLVIRKLNNVHNHPLDPDLFVQYPEQRRLERDAKEMVKTMLKMRVKVKLLQDHIHCQGSSFITVKDLHNMRQKMKKEEFGTQTDEERLLAELGRLGDEDPDAAISVQTGETGDLECLLVVTGEMRRTYEMFPEVLMVDGTYRVNKLRMPLYLLIVEDGYGQGRIVGFSLVANEKRETLENLIGEFGQIHNLEKVKTVVVDKDQNEIAAVQKFMPDVSIQLCKFHIMQAFARELKKCAVNQEVQSTITQLVRQMVYARSKTAYDNSFGQLLKVAPQQFVDYYYKNWLESAPMWCAYQTNMHINLGNTTNNRMESINQKIKDVLHRNLSVPEAVQGLLLVCRASNYAVRHRSFVQHMTVPYRLNDDDEVVDIIVKKLTPYAANIVVHELKTARSQTEKYACTPEKCCVLKTTMGLPCRHIFAARMKKKNEILFLGADVFPRWCLGYGDEVIFKRKLDQVESRVLSNPEKKNVPKSKEEKYRDVMVVCKSLADLVSTLGSKEFTEKLDTLNLLFTMWSKGQKVVLVDIMEDNQLGQEPGKTRFHHSSDKNSFIQDGIAQNSSEKTNNNIEPNTQSNSTTEKCQEVEEIQKRYVCSETDNEVGSDSEENPPPSPLFGKKKRRSFTHLSNMPDDQENIMTSTTEANIEEHRPSEDSTNECPSSLSNIETSIKTGLIRTGTFSDVLQHVTNIRLPSSPPVRGRSKIKKKKHKNVEKTENMFQARKRKRTREEKDLQSIDHQCITESITLKPEEIAEVRNGGMLTDTHISAALRLLKKQHSDIQGFQDPLLGSKLQFDICKGKFVQILHDGNLHWLTVSNVMGSNHEIDVYDSLASSTHHISMNVKMQIAAITMTQKKHITLRIRKCQRQKGGVDCGLFAIAMTASLCKGKDPTNLTYNQDVMRRHLEDCLNKSHIAEFPHKEVMLKSNKETNKISKVDLHCICRLPDNHKERMIECSSCKEWYHQTCLSIPKEMFMDKTLSEGWLCTHCGEK